MVQNIITDFNQQILDSVFGSIQIMDQHTGKTKEYPMHSLLKNFGSFFYEYAIQWTTATTGNTGLQCTKSNGVSDAYGTLYSYAVANGNQITSHISIGTGSATKTNSMIAMGGLIPNTKISWLTLQPFYTLSDGTKSVTFQKKFTNTTTQSINITELGFTDYHSAGVYRLYGYDQLETPYELGSGSTSVFKFKLHFNYNFGNYFIYNLLAQGGGGNAAATETAGGTVAVGTYFKPLYQGYGNSLAAGIVLGTSSAAVGSNEYKLAGIIPTTTMSCTVNTIQNGFEEPQQNLYLYRTFTSLAETDTVINQIGLYAFIYSVNKTCLIWRKPLTTPITVSAGDQLLMQLRIAPNY